MKSISNIGKNLPGKISMGRLSLSRTGINLPVFCIDGVTSIASAGEISSIAASGLVLYKTASNSGSSGDSNSSSDENIDANDANETGEAEKTYTPCQSNSDIITDPVQLRRTYEIDGTKIEMQSGHAFNRSRSGGWVKDIDTMDEAENAVLKDFTNKLNNNELKIPHSGDVEIELNSKPLLYRVV